MKTVKHYVEARLGKRIEQGSALFTWLIPFCTDLLNKFRVGSDGRTAYERITSHTCEVAQIGLAEIVDFKLETDKNSRHKADSEFNAGVCLGFAWRSTDGTLYKCRTVRRRAVDVAFSVAMTDGLDVRCEEYTLKGANTSMHVSFPRLLGETSPLRSRHEGPALFQDVFA